MKHDINLLQKRKPVQYSGKKLGVILLVLLLIGAALYAGIALPLNMLADAKSKLAALDAELSAESGIDQELTDKTNKNVALIQLVQQLQDISDNKESVLHYIEALEASLPTSAYISNLTMADNELTVNGIVPRDEVLATFALRLRETKLFSDVYVTTSTVLTEDKETSFQLVATLPEYLNTAPDIIDGSEQAGGSELEQPTSTPAADTTEAAK